MGRRYKKFGVSGIAQLSEKLLDESNSENDIPILKYFAQLHMKNSFSFEFIGGLLKGQAGRLHKKGKKVDEHENNVVDVMSNEMVVNWVIDVEFDAI